MSCIHVKRAFHDLTDVGLKVWGRSVMLVDRRFTASRTTMTLAPGTVCLKLAHREGVRQRLGVKEGETRGGDFPGPLHSRFCM